MIKQYKIMLQPDKRIRLEHELAYRIYTELLYSVPSEVGDIVHGMKISPVSQHVEVNKKDVLWTVNLLGDEAEKMFSSVLNQKSEFNINKENVNLKVMNRVEKKICDADEMFEVSEKGGSTHILEFKTTTSFRSNGTYINIPNNRLIINNLINKWNACFPDCNIEDEDGEAVNAIANGIQWKKFNLYDSYYNLKGMWIPGFCGTVEVNNVNKGFHKQITDMLLYFSEFAGIGIKTTLGMGGVKHVFKK